MNPLMANGAHAATMPFQSAVGCWWARLAVAEISGGVWKLQDGVHVSMHVPPQDESMIPTGTSSAS